MEIDKVVQILGKELDKAFKGQITKLNDVSGFSIKVPIPKKIFKKTKNGDKNNYLTLCYLVIDGKNKVIDKKTLYLIKFESRFVKDINGSYMVPDNLLNKNMFRDVGSPDEIFFYPSGKNFFYNKKNRYFTIKELIEYFQKIQFNIPIKARINIFFGKTIPLIHNLFISTLLEKILFVISGDKIKYKPSDRFLYTDKTKPDGGLKIPNVILQKEINLFGVTTTYWIASSYCLIHITTFIVYETLASYNIVQFIVFFKKFFNNNFLALCYSISSLIIYSQVLPRYLINSLKSVAENYPGIQYKLIEID